jgi:hypothetical protein
MEITLSINVKKMNKYYSLCLLFNIFLSVLDYAAGEK